jgi:hypothetical protein
MTAVGKILVFLNLVFSLVVGGFVVASYLTRVHWVDANKKLEQQLQVAQASQQTYQNEVVKAEQKAADTVAQAQAQLKKLQDDLQAQVAENTQIRTELENLKKTTVQQSSVAALTSEEVSKRQSDVSKLRETIKKETDLNNALVQKNNELINQATAATIEKQAALDRNKRLEEQLRRVEQDVARMRANTGGTATARAGNGKNPPPESVEGLIKTTDPSSGLMTITIGSDAGLAKGHTLEVFRLSPIPSQSKYLGTIRILEAGHKEAVAQPVGRLLGTPQPGDRVASRITG